jgi:hypothetical protein
MKTETMQYVLKKINEGKKTNKNRYEKYNRKETKSLADCTIESNNKLRYYSIYLGDIYAKRPLVAIFNRVGVIHKIERDDTIKKFKRYDELKKCIIEESGNIPYNLRLPLDLICDLYEYLMPFEVEDFYSYDTIINPS